MEPGMSRNGDGDQLRAEAAVWAVRLDRGQLSEDEAAELAAWEQDPQRLGALVRARSGWLRINELVSADHQQKPTPSGFSWRRAGVGLAASACIVLAAGGWMLALSNIGWITAPENHIRPVALADGSRVVLDTATVLQVRFRPAQRDVYLRRGEAIFQVAHNRLRPFVVHAGDVDVRAVGTRFSVRRDGTNVRVLVAEGTVEVTRRNAGQRDSVHQQLAANGALLASRDHAEAETLAPREIERRFAWSDGLLMFDGQSLATAILEINRYAERPVVLDDPRLGDRSIVGVFKAGESEDFAESAAAAFGGRVILKDSAIHIAAR